MQQLEDESLEDYLERFIYTLYKSNYSDLLEDAVRTLFLKGISEDLLESINLMEASDISHKTLAQIDDVCKNYSRSRGEVAKIFRNFSPTPRIIFTHLTDLCKSFMRNIASFHEINTF